MNKSTKKPNPRHYGVIGSDSVVLAYPAAEVERYVAELEQRAEAAEVEKAGAEERCRMMFDAKNHWAERARAAEAKLAELEKQEPVVWCNENDLKLMVNKRMIGGMMTVRHHGERPLFTRPAPATNLAELVPPMKDDSIPGKNDSYIDMCDGWNACRAAILRNIEGTK